MKSYNRRNSDFRTRVVLSVKKDVVALYFDFLAAPNVTVSDIRTDVVADDQDYSSDDDDENVKELWNQSLKVHEIQNFSVKPESRILKNTTELSRLFQFFQCFRLQLNKRNEKASTKVL
jgi:hypothetical protein